jgi:hypothetical protein
MIRRAVVPPRPALLVPDEAVMMEIWKMLIGKAGGKLPRKSFSD